MQGLILSRIKGIRNISKNIGFSFVKISTKQLRCATVLCYNQFEVMIWRNTEQKI